MSTFFGSRPDFPTPVCPIIATDKDLKVSCSTIGAMDLVSSFSSWVKDYLFIILLPLFKRDKIFSHKIIIIID